MTRRRTQEKAFRKAMFDRRVDNAAAKWDVQETFSPAAAKSLGLRPDDPRITVVEPLAETDPIRPRVATYD